MRYQTEIHVAPDRYVCLQLPTYFPAGRAWVTVTFDLDGPTGNEPRGGDEPDREDVEWWDEFDDESGRGR